MDVTAWLRGLGLERYAGAFSANDVNAQTLRKLTGDDLMQIGVTSVGHRRKLIQAIAALGTAPAHGIDTHVAAAPEHSFAERRPLSVLYCDLVGSTQLSQRLDPEDYRELIRKFHDTCLQQISQFDGWVANFIGDCVLAYFGWPRAHEDDAERAVRAGRSMVRAVHGVDPPGGMPLSVRIGIATGSAVVGDLVREGPAQEQSAVGLVPNLGARLQALAEPGQIVIDEATRRLLGAGFELEPLGETALQGLHRPVPVYCVKGERLIATRFEARLGQQLTPMAGRDEELRLLLVRWAQANDGEGQAVLLVGEAGIGKSRLVRAMQDACAAQPHGLVRWQCSPFHTGSALWPVIQRLERTADLSAEDSSETALDKVETLMGRGNGEATALYATLLGLKGSQRYGPIEMSPQMLRERTLEVLAKQLFEMAEQRPLLLAVEDAHWIDPTTLELLERCLESIDRARLMIVITSRPDHQPSLEGAPSMTRLLLNRLSRTSMQAIVQHLSGAQLRAQTLATIAERADGVPLYVEELTKAVLETGETSVPPSLYGSLMARLDRHPEMKEVAQLASCIGRDFDVALLQAVADSPEAVAPALDKLVAAEIIFRRGDKSQPRFMFKHALVQQAAYESLLGSHQRDIHGRLLQVLEDTHASTPHEILAHHAVAAMETDKAVGYWQKAGQHALDKSAYIEARGFFESAIGLIRSMVDGIDRRCLEVELLMGLSVARGLLTGTSLSAIEDPIMRASHLLDDIAGDPSLRLQVQYGLWNVHFVRGRFPEALQLARAMLEASDSNGNADATLIARRLLATSYSYLGDFMQAQTQYRQAMPLLDSTGPQRLLAGVDQGVTTRFQYSWMLCIQGFPDQGHLRLEEALSLCGAQAPAQLRAQVHIYTALSAAIVRDGRTLALAATALHELATRHRMLPWYGNEVDVLCGWTAMESDCPGEQDIAIYRRGLQRIEMVGRRAHVPFLMAWLAKGLSARGQHDEALQLIDGALTMCKETSQGWCDAELWRTRGELHLRSQPNDEVHASRCFDEALRLARLRGAKLWELRAAVSMARVWARHGQNAQALDLLEPVYGWFTEGFDTRDLIEAQVLLGGLAGKTMPAGCSNS